MRRQRFRSCFVVALMAGGLMVGGMAPDLPGIGPKTRDSVDVDAAPWRILGRVQIELGQKCTGFMVAPSVAVTAAHCLWLSRVRRYVQPASVHFLLGYRKGRWRAEARVTHYVIPPSYNPRQPLTTSPSDRAVLILDHVLTPANELLPMVDAHKGQAAMLVGYQKDRKELAYGDQHCQITRLRLPMIDHNCAATYGVSGAPLLVRTPNGWGIAGVDVTARTGLGGSANGFFPGGASGP